MNGLPLYRKENHTDSAKDEHGPMGESAENDLTYVISKYSVSVFDLDYMWYLLLI